MGTPASNGKLCTKLADMSIGDYIRCEYVAPTANAAGIFQNLGADSALGEIPDGVAATANGHFYFIKAEKGLLVADRRLQQGISGAAVNAAGFLTGTVKELGGEQCLIRILSRNEFVSYISKSSLQGCTTPANPGVWNGKGPGAIFSNGGGGMTWEDVVELNQDRSNGNIHVSYCIDGYTYNNNPAYFGGLAQGGVGLPADIPFGAVSNLTHSAQYQNNSFYYAQQNHFNAVPSFRPALEFIDNAKSINIWY